jgi:hypothetical protein
MFGAQPFDLVIDVARLNRAAARTIDAHDDARSTLILESLSQRLHDESALAAEPELMTPFTSTSAVCFSPLAPLSRLPLQPMATASTTNK